jgi:hypothetical protein
MDILMQIATPVLYHTVCVSAHGVKYRRCSQVAFGPLEDSKVLQLALRPGLSKQARYLTRFSRTYRVPAHETEYVPNKSDKTTNQSRLGHKLTQYSESLAHVTIFTLRDVRGMDVDGHTHSVPSPPLLLLGLVR